MVAKKVSTRKPVNKKSTKKSTPSVSSITNGNGKQSTNRIAGITSENERELMLNAVLTRSAFLQEFLTDPRDLNKELGYPETGELDHTTFKFFYDRLSVATRVVQLLPEECWSLLPNVIEDEDSDTETAFELAWDDLSLSLHGNSKFKSDEGNPIWEYLKRVDVLSGIGFFGILFLGLDNAPNLEEPVEPREGQKLLFVRAFDQTSVQISEYDSDVTSFRFGLPKFYNIEFSSPNDALGGGLGTQAKTQKVHWSRVIHVADNIGSNEVVGVPRMRPVFNRLWDLRKLYGGSAEMYWKGAFPGISIETHPSLGANVSFDTKVMKEQMLDYMEGLQRYLALNGASANSLAPQVADPTPQIDTQIEAICVQLGTPKRIFLGSERGELASSQDIITWTKRLNTRRNRYITPRIIVPFVDRLIELGVLPEPEEYHVTWNESDDQTGLEKAEISVKSTEALVKYVAGDVQSIMMPIDFLVRIMGMTVVEATSVIESAEEAFEEVEEGRVSREVEMAREMAAVALGTEDDEEDAGDEENGVNNLPSN